MRTWQIVLVVVASLASACSKRKLHWIDTRATTVAIDGFTVPIPAGWRDGAEATDDDMKEVLRKTPGAHVLVRDDFDGATIVIKGAATEPTTTPPCDEIAKLIATQEDATATGVKNITIEGDGACHWTYTKGDIEGDYWMRYHADNIIAIMCFTQHDKANLATCETARQSVHPTR